MTIHPLAGHLDDWLMADFGPLLEAQAVVEVSGDRELIRAATDVVVAAGAVLGVATKTTTAPQLGDGVGSQQGRLRFRSLLPLRRDPAVDSETEEAIRRLGQEVRKFAHVTRDRVGVGDAGAIIHAFPELFGEGDSSPAATKSGHAEQEPLPVE